MSNARPQNLVYRQTMIAGVTQTGSTDYILIKNDSFIRALDALAKNGYSISIKHELLGSQ